MEPGGTAGLTAPSNLVDRSEGESACEGPVGGHSDGPHLRMEFLSHCGNGGRRPARRRHRDDGVRVIPRAAPGGGAESILASMPDAALVARSATGAKADSAAVGHGQVTAAGANGHP